MRSSEFGMGNAERTLCCFVAGMAARVEPNRSVKWDRRGEENGEPVDVRPPHPPAPLPRCGEGSCEDKEQGRQGEHDGGFAAVSSPCLRDW